MRFFAVILALIAAICPCADACTSAIVDGAHTLRGNILLWKHRDTDAVHCFVERVSPKTESEIAYIGLFNGGDSLMREAWAGLNAEGFGIINTASYNLMPDTAAYRDREGEVMALALSRCRSLADFEVLLSSLPRPMGVQANFGVIDHSGDGAYYEVDDHSFKKFPLNDAVDGMIVRTNFSVSGDPTEGYGYIRDSTARLLLTPVVRDRKTEPATFTDFMSRSFYHSLLGIDAAKSDDEWVVDQDFIPRATSAASVVIEGGQRPVMWVMAGYPPCSVALPATVDSVPRPLLPEGSDWVCPMSRSVRALRDSIAFPITRGSGPRYINMKALRPVMEGRRQESLDNYKEFYR